MVRKPSTWQSVKKWVLPGLLVVAVLFSIGSRLLGGTKQAALTTTPTPTPISTAISPSPTPTGSSNDTPIEEDEPLKGSDLTFQLLSAEPASFAAFDGQRQAIYYLSGEDSGLKRLTLASRDTDILATGWTDLQSVSWPPNGKWAVVRSLNNLSNAIANPFHRSDKSVDAVVNGYYNFDTKKFTPLADPIGAVVALNTTTIFYRYDDGSRANLSIAKPDGTGWSNVGTTTTGATLKEVASQAYIQEGIGQPIRRFDSAGKELAKLTVPSDLSLAQSSWSSNGSSAVYWIVKDGFITIKQWQDGKTQERAIIPQKSANQAFLWDNEKKALYSISASGVEVTTGF